MKHLIIFILFPLLVSECNRVDSSEESPLFYNTALQDSLILYISQVKEIRNPYNAPTIMDISIRIEEDSLYNQLDTIVSISAVYGLLMGPIVIDETNLNITKVYDNSTARSYDAETKSLGAGIVNGRICAIKEIEKGIGSNLVDLNQLSIPREEYDFFYHYEGPFYNDHVSRSTREYLLNGKDNVILIGKTIGDFELH